METPTRMIEFRGVTKRYGTLAAVNKVAFSIARGEYCALLGPNGAGKTTLVRMLLHFSVMSAGAITIDGLPVSDPHSRLAIGYLSEQPRIPAQLTGWEYLKRCAQLGGTGSSGIADDCARIVQVIGMQGCEHQKARTYSKGMVQRFCLGATLLGDPRLLILDEPTSGLDPIGIREVRVLLESLRNRGMTLLLNSHFLSEVEAICDTAAILHRGSLLVKDSISAIVKENETLEDVFVRVVSRC
jgi:ABC-2 type transport system ATP-binding protein